MAPLAQRKLKKSLEEVLHMIIAVDFDGILCSNKFPEIGTPKYDNIIAIRRLIDEGHEVILWTSRVEDELDKAINWCNDYGLHFCAVNDNAPSNKEQYKDTYNSPPRKIYADVYIDDHNIEYVMEGYRGEDSLTSYLKQLRGRK